VIVHTAFPGDVVLALPLARRLRETLPGARVGFVATPAAAPLLANHPWVDEVIPYDKRGTDRGWKGIRRLSGLLRESRYEAAYVPHRSLRSALLVLLARIPRRIGFDRSAGRWFLTEIVRYDPSIHEIERNLSLFPGKRESGPAVERPGLFPSAHDMVAVDRLLLEWRSRGEEAARRSGRGFGRMIGVAPGSVWATKRWPADRFAATCRLLLARDRSVILIGGPADADLCAAIEREVNDPRCCNTAGRLTLLQSAELIRRCEALVSNDSAPVHLATAVRTPVVAIFGPTAPGFGFAPRGSADAVLETNGLACRPCAIHGGTTCPTGTFECMLSIPPTRVVAQVETLIHASHTHG
jgi:heptosyltransferase-2